MNFFSYFLSDRIALATYSAQPVTPDQNSAVYGRVYPIVAELRSRIKAVLRRAGTRSMPR